MARQIVFLSQDSMDGYVHDDDLAIPHLAARGIDVQTISWRKPEDWSQYDAVIVRTPWDYMTAPDAFLEVIDQIADATRLANPAPVMRWNLDKRYLDGLSGQGVATVPTLFGEHLTDSQFDRLLGDYPDGAVIKPVISAGSRNTFALKPPVDSATRAEVLAAHAQSVFMWQPFVRSVVDEGEYSLFYFNGEFSHAIVKRPKSGDFRVQEEFGGDIVSVEATTAQRAAAVSVLNAIEQTLLYARVDLVRGSDDQWWLIELEIIEPSLYLRTHPDAPARFAAAIEHWLDH